jgi:MoxR-like ATPase
MSSPAHNTSGGQDKGFYKKDLRSAQEKPIYDHSDRDIEGLKQAEETLKTLEKTIIKKKLRGGKKGHTNDEIQNIFKEIQDFFGEHEQAQNTEVREAIKHIGDDVSKDPYLHALLSHKNVNVLKAVRDIKTLDRVRRKFIQKRNEVIARFTDKGHTPSLQERELVDSLTGAIGKIDEDLESVSLDTEEAYYAANLLTLRQYKQQVESQALVETKSVEDMRERIEGFALTGRPIFLQGPPGTGKTEMAMHVATTLPTANEYLNNERKEHGYSVERKGVNKQPFRIISASKHTDHSEFAGHQVIRVKALPEEERARFYDAVDRDMKEWEKKHGGDSSKMVTEIRNTDGTSTLLLNGKEELYRGGVDRWYPHPEGVVILKHNVDGTSTLSLNGKEELYRGAIKDWEPHPEGVVIRVKNDDGTSTFFLNGKEELYRGGVDGWANYSIGFGKNKEKERERQLQVILEANKLTHGQGVETDFWVGPMYECMEKGIPFIVDEANALPPDVFIKINHFLTRRPGDTVAIQEDSGREITIKKGFCFIFTGNIGGQYQGRHKLEQSFINRIGDAMIEYDYLPQDELGHIVYAKLMSGALVRGSLVMPEKDKEEIEKFIGAVTLAQSIFSGKEDLQIPDGAGGQMSINERQLLKNTPLSMRNVTMILDAYKATNFAIPFDHAIYNSFIRTITDPAERYAYFEIFRSAGFFGDPKDSSKVNPVIFVHTTRDKSGKVTQFSLNLSGDKRIYKEH